MLRNICWFSFLIWGNWINTVFLRRWVLRWLMMLTSLLEEYSASVSSYHRLKYQICSLNSWIICTTVRCNLNNLLCIQIQPHHYHCYHMQKFLYYLRSTSFPVGPKPLTNTEKPCKNSYKCLHNLRYLHSQVLNALGAKLNILILHFSMKRENQTILDKRPWDTWVI